MELKPLSLPERCGNNNKSAVIARSLNGVKADIGILKISDYNGDPAALIKDFKGEKFLYLPPYIPGSEIERVKELVKPFDGIYSGGNYAVPLSKQLKKKLFAGVGFNLFNGISVDACPADYIALSKELTTVEAADLRGENTFALTAGDIKVMDLIYCPFGKSCQSCDKREIYSLTDADGRAFPMFRYVADGCKFELFNCAKLLNKKPLTGALYDFTTFDNPAGISRSVNDLEGLRKIFKNCTKGHTELPVN